MIQLPKTFIWRWHKEIDRKFFTKYNSLRQRCKDKNDKNYWWKWIQCERNSIWDFAKDMYPSFIEHCKIHWVNNTTLDRIDNNWNYCKENCRWVTIYKQLHNRRYDEKKYLIWDNSYSCLELSNLLWLSRSWINQRYKKYIEWEITKEEFFSQNKRRGISNQYKITIDNTTYLISELAKIWWYTRDTEMRYYNKFKK